LRRFSRHTIEDLRAALPLRLAMPALEPFLEENVAKEARKDALVIGRAGAPPSPQAARELLAAARVIDREFLERIEGFPVRIAIPYERIEPLRLRRIELMLDTARPILEAWRQGRRVRDVVTRSELQRRLQEMLRLYAEETVALSGSVRLPVVLEPLRVRLAQRLREAMERAARSLVRGAHVAGQKG
jgi:hypothetical protein